MGGCRFKYGWNFCIVSLSGVCLSNVGREGGVIGFGNDERSGGVRKIKFVIVWLAVKFSKVCND